MNSRLLGIVLVGGRSSRMGTDKAKLLHPSGMTFLQHAVGRMREVCGQVCISGSAAESEGTDASTGCSILPDPVAYRGPVTGIAAAVDLAAQQQQEGCFVTPVDMPDLTAEHLRGLLHRWDQFPEMIVCATTENHNSIQPLVAIYPTRLQNELHQLAHSDQRSLFRWIRTQPYQAVPLQQTACKNVNTPTDLEDTLPKR
ncbi:molybdenum cofactor guanylyltransferase [Novipirellula artificiosorum]|uniref:Probable molybdenum cofactor guanylyltransferase n=1 Tax=Novipirellula artificiosorum TaxID=2528016 RepID=A0A5C6DII3_9BACT|nr:molybdenum cofactor guanylyltransferase [Novipirellula artificiosorum]TWU35894.1 Molybdenum cofactor guanylyltransferase [Novipirellula artificiosorum]